MAISRVEQWEKDGKNYQAGCIIYSELGKSTHLKQLFSTGASVYNRKRLYKELMKLSVEISQSISDGKYKMSHGEALEKLPAPVQKLESEVKIQLKELSFLHSRLELLKTDLERKNAALRILDLDKSIGATYTKLRAFTTSGNLPEKVQDPESIEGLSVKQLMKMKTNLRSYISRSKDEKKIEFWKEKLARVEKKLEA